MRSKILKQFHAASLGCLLLVALCALEGRAQGQGGPGHNGAPIDQGPGTSCTGVVAGLGGGGQQVNACTGYYYDPGGPTGNYGSNEDIVVTICPNNGPGGGGATSVRFLSWSVAASDELSIYNGAAAIGVPIAVGSSTNSLAGNTYTSSEPSGCLTFRWQSDASLNAPGWAARIVTAPNPGDNTSANLCATGPSVSLFSLLSGDPDPGGTWKDPLGAPHSDLFDPTIDPAGNWIYTQSGPAPCPPANATLTIAKILAPDAGTDGTLSVCANDAPVGLFSALGGTPDAGGTWIGPGGAAHSGVFDPAIDAAGVYTYTVVGSSPCLTASATVTVTINQPANAGINGSITVCSNGAPFSLFAQLGGTPAPSGAWTGPGGAPVTGTYTPGSSAPGVYTYTVAGTPPCPAAVSTVTASQVEAPNAGLSNAITVCSDDPAFSMRSQLLGSPSVGGTWVGPSGAHADTFDPAVDTGGLYTYTVAGISPCANATATLTITVSPAPNAGTNGSVTLCSTDGVFALISALGGSPQPGGTWRDPSNAVHSGNFVPGTNAPGIYTYRVVGNSPCDPATATVTVTVNTAPNAGIGTNVVRCSNAAAFDLFLQLGGSPQSGGSWTGPSGAHSSIFTPGADQPGAYTYTVAGLAPCANATAVVNVGVVQAPWAGVDGTTTVCGNAAPFDLFTLLTGSPDANGTWTAPGGASVSSLFTPGTSAPGVYTYTVVGNAPCSNDQSSVTANVVAPPNPGTNSSIAVCSNDAPVDLFALLGGSPQPGGTWTRPGGAAHSGTYLPATEPGGNYTYTVAGSGPCTSLSAVVQVVRTVTPNAGSNGSTTVCSSSGPFALINLLGGAPAGGGIWLDPGSTPVSGTFTPGTSVPGTYAYVVSGSGPCENDTAFATVNVNIAPVAGGSASITVCDNAAPFQLSSVLTGTPMGGGSWTRPNGSPSTGTFTPGISAPGAYTYTVAGQAPCLDASAVVTVVVNHQPNAGTNDNFTRCSTDNQVNLLNELGGSPEPGGTWTGLDGPSNGIFFPSSSTPGAYVYTLTGIAPCVNASATVTAVVNQAPNAGGDGETTVCQGSGTIDLFSLLVGPYDAGGTWTNEDNVGVLSGSFFDYTGVPPGTYEFDYQIDGNGLCNDDHAHVDITIVALLEAGNNSSPSVCGSSTQVNLFNLLGGGAQPGGTWVDLSATGSLSGQFFNATAVSPGVYLFRYRLIGSAGCNSDSSLVTLTVVQAPNAGTNATTTVCSNASSFSMFALLGGAPQAGGVWRVGAPNGPPHGATYNPLVDTPNDFFYVVSGNPPCSSASAKVTVNEVPAPFAGNDANRIICSTAAPFNMFALLTGNPNTGGSWFFNNQNHSATFDPSLDVQGVYEYRVPGTAPCTEDVATLTVSVVQGANAGCNSSVTVCSGDPSVVLFGVLTCDPQNGGFWLGPDLAPQNGTYIPGSSIPGDYRYVVLAGSQCTNDTAIVSVFENPSPDAGGPGNGSFCTNGSPTNLITLLTGTPDPFGSWVGPAPANPPFNGVFVPGTSAPGVYTYTVTNSCGTATATATVQVDAPPNAGCNNTITLCSSGSAINMLNALGCSPAPGGVWTGPLPSATVVSGFFQPGLSVPGTYRYRVAGTGACTAATAFLTVNVNIAANAGNDASLSLCNTGAQVNLFPLLGPNAQAGGSWFFNGTVPHSGTVLPAVDATGTYVYRVTGAAPCSNDEASVSVQIFQAPNAGIDGLAETCSDAAPFALINFITGNPQLNGNWTGPSGAAHSGIYEPPVNAPGLYKYRLPGNAGCPADSSYVTVIENPAVDAGGDAVVVVCSTTPEVDLFALLTGTPQPGGSWFAPNGTATTGIYVPGVSQPGIYKYKLIALAPCRNDSATVSVFESQAPDAGISTLAPICSSQPPVALVDLLGGDPDNNGTWTFAGQPHGPFFDPSVDAAGPYVYTVLGVSPCVDATSQVVVTITQATSAGSNGNLTACVGADEVQLFDGLGGQPSNGGSWSTDCGTGSLNGGIFDASGMSSGSVCTFTYSQPANGPCPASSAQVTLTIVDALDAGEDGSAEVCQGQLVDLFGVLTGTPQSGGYWVNIDGAPGLFGSVFNTAAVAASTTWRFDHVLPGSAQCDADTARVTITVLDGPFAGNDGGINVCSNTVVNLGTGLSGGPDAGGTWFTPTWAPHSGTFVPATDQPGTYHYVVGGVGTCPSDTADVEVTLITAADAGNDVTLALCSTDGSVDMFTLLGPDAQVGGNWTYVTGGNVPHSSVYNPAIDAPGIYRYAVQGTPPCANDFAFVTVNEPQAPDAGLPNDIQLCSSQSPVLMRTQLGGTPQTGGTWVYVTGGDVPHGNFFDPSSDLPGVYRYTVAGTAPCADASAELTITVVTAGNAGASATLDACVTQTAVNLFAALGPNAQTGGTWTDQGGSGALTGDIFNPSVAGNGSWAFQYTILGNGPCAAVSATVTVNVGAGSSAGNDSTVTVCGNVTAYDLFDALGGSPTPGGTWTDLLGTGATLNGSSLNVSQLPIGGPYQFGYTVVDAGCGNVSAVVFLTATDFPEAGSGTTLTLCSNGPQVDLFAALGGDPDLGGTWTGPGNVPHNGIFVPGSEPDGNYTYTVVGTAPCGNASAVINITVNDPPNAGANGVLLACDTLTALSLFNGLQGAPQTGGTWEDLDGSGGLTNGSLNTTGIAPGEYYYRYTVSVAGCGNATALVKVQVVSSVSVVDLVRTCIERDRTYVVSFTIEEGDTASYLVSGLSGSITSTAPYVFTSDPIFTSIPFSVSVQDQYACGAEVVEGTSPCDFTEDVFIPESFSPNGDGVNEQFLIPGIEGYPNNTISIFNRWGAKMYDAAGYDNRTVVWDGSSPNATIAGPAPTGTYYYVLDLGNGDEPFTGFIYLNR